jgi:hypothetical protein
MILTIQPTDRQVEFKFGVDSDVGAVLTIWEGTDEHGTPFVVFPVYVGPGGAGILPSFQEKQGR